MKIMFMGDPHAQISNLTEMNKLVDFTIEKCAEAQVDALVVSGDLFHTHSVIRMEVQNFWISAIDKMSKSPIKKIYLLVGNHDQIGDKQRESQMSALDIFSNFAKNVIVIKDKLVDGELGFIAYTSDNNKFLADAKALFEYGAKRLFCHQTFDGSKFDNGFYAPHGIDPQSLSVFTEVVSGHIHTSQTVGANVFYPGTPKWDSLSDANQDKGIWLSEAPNKWEIIPTDSVCTKIVKITVLESDEDKEISIDSKHSTIVELVGNSSWINKKSKSLRNKCRVVARPTDAIDRRSSGEVSGKMSLNDYLDKDSTIYDKSYKEKISKYIEEICQ